MQLSSYKMKRQKQRWGFLHNMADLQIKKPLQTETGQLINYDFADVARQTGYLSYYLTDNNSGALSLVPYIVYAELGNTITDSSVKNSTIFSGAYIRNYSLTFNTPQNIKGDLIINAPLSISGGLGSKQYFSGAIYHYNGIDETLLGSVNGQDYGFKTRSYNDIQQLSINIPSVIHFKTGDQLRFKTSIISSGAIQNYLFYDPGNRTFSTLSSQTITQYKVLIPIRIEI